MKLQFKIWLTNGGEMVFGRGRARLLEEVERTGSISAAARELDLSYRHAWTMIRTSEERLGVSLLERVKGGRGGGGAALTPEAKELLAEFRRVEGEFGRLAKETASEFESVLD